MLTLAANASSKILAGPKDLYAPILYILGVCAFRCPVCVVFVCNNHHGNLHRILVGVGLVTEDDERPVLGQRLSHREVPQLGADDLYSGAL